MVELISREKLSWLAGILDGEGSFHAGFRRIKATKNKHPLLRVRVDVGNTDVFMIKEISEIYYHLGIKFHYGTTKNNGKNESWTLRICISGKGNVKKLIVSIRPYIVAKAKQADKLMELIFYRESLGYIGGWHDEESATPLWKDKNLNRMISELKALKKQEVLPSETRRKANFPLGIDGIVRST